MCLFRRYMKQSGHKMKAPNEFERCLLKKIFRFAVATRILYIILQVIANAAIPDHDAGVYNPPRPWEADFNVLDSGVHAVLGGFRRWDAVYFLHIAQFGYTYENCLVFFPLYPVLTFIVANTVCYPLQFLLTYASVILLSGVLLNQFLFVLTAQTLFLLGVKVTRNDTVAYTAAMLFCINPATVFVLAPYSEILFMFLSVQGMLKLENNSKLLASLLFGLSCAVRSNGILNIGYVIFYFAKDAVTRVSNMKKGMFRSVSSVFTCTFILFTLNIIPFCCLMLLSLLPFVLYQIYTYLLYCSESVTVTVPGYLRQYGEEQGYTVWGREPSEWCRDTLPLAYSYIQKHHWNLGLFSYYEFKQIPNFLLAAPVTVLSLCAVVSFYRHNSYTCWTLGLDPAGARKKEDTQEESREEARYQLRGAKLVPYVVHLMVMTIFGWLFMHIQVLTRLLFSSAPLLYWYSAKVISKETPTRKSVNPYSVRGQVPPVGFEDCEKNENRYLSNSVTKQLRSFTSQTLPSKLIFVYFLGYSVVGVVVFCNFLPWT